MFFETENLIVSKLNKEDLPEVLAIYHSNPDFLQAHMDQTEVDIGWLVKEQEAMKKIGFEMVKVCHKNSKKIIGFIDFCAKEESYLSLQMIHGDYRDRGYGKEIYRGFEAYLQGKDSKVIRIDVVYDYNQKVLQFWKDWGFKEIERIQLQWADKILNAMVMKKNI